MGTRIEIKSHNHDWQLLRMDKKHRKCGQPRRKVWRCIECKGYKYQTLMCPCEQLPGEAKK